jgi:hypothetical protein
VPFRSTVIQDDTSTPWASKRLARHSTSCPSVQKRNSIGSAALFSNIPAKGRAIVVVAPLTIFERGIDVSYQSAAVASGFKERALDKYGFTAADVEDDDDRLEIIWNSRAAVVLDSYMSERAAIEGTEYELDHYFYVKRLREGVASFFGVTLTDDPWPDIADDTQNPAFAKTWKEKSAAINERWFLVISEKQEHEPIDGATQRDDEPCH